MYYYWDHYKPLKHNKFCDKETLEVVSGGGGGGGLNGHPMPCTACIRRILKFFFLFNFSSANQWQSAHCVWNFGSLSTLLCCLLSNIHAQNISILSISILSDHTGKIFISCHTDVLCILTNFQVLPAPKSCLKYFSGGFSNFFVT